MRYISALFLCFSMASLLRESAGSAIPMWEFLSRDEKMGRLFYTLMNLVQDYCSTSSIPDCNKVMLLYGMTNLVKMDDDSLDMMDPYQRGARQIIWETMMKGGFRSPSRDQGSYEYYSPEGNSGDTNHLGSREETASSQSQGDYMRPTHYLSGPMVVRVLPDGSPVPEDSASSSSSSSSSSPSRGHSMTYKDEDAEELALLKRPSHSAFSQVPLMPSQTPRNRRHNMMMPPSSSMFRIL